MRALRRAFVALATMVAAGSSARAQPLEPTGQVLFARGTSLWRTDSKGKGPAVEVAELPGPASSVRAIRSDPTGRYLVLDHDGRWYWGDLTVATPTLTAIPCDPPVRIAGDGSGVSCTSKNGRLARFRFGTERATELAVAGSDAALVRAGSDAALVWTDHRGIWRKSVVKEAPAVQLAPQAPLRHFLPAPDGTRAVGVYLDEAPATSARTSGAARPQLYSFALDGVAARRKAIRDGVPVEWSWDSRWVLVQDGERACVMRGVGGEYKCWPGFQVLSASPDGSTVLLLGRRRDPEGAPVVKRPEKKRPEKKPATPHDQGDEGGEGDLDLAPAGQVTAIKGPFSLYRGRLGGAQTDSPALIERIVDGAALWLPTAK